MTSEFEDIPTRSADGLAALDVFYNDFNDINFYVEDEDQENLYEVILSRLFPSLRITRIFPLGGKPAVLSHAESLENDALQVFRAYILDKDLSDFLGTLSTHPNVFYLDRYCIENYFLDESAFVEIVIESHPKQRRAEVARALDITTVINSTFNDLRPLFIYFACVQRFQLGLKNCSTAPEKYCKEKRLWELEPTALSDYVSRLNSAARGILPPMLNPLTDERMLDVVSAENHKLVSGKYALTMIFHYIKSKYGLGSITFYSFIYRLAKNCSTSSLGDLAPRILASANVFNQAKGRPTLGE